MAKIKFYQGTNAKVSAKSIEEGAFYVITDTGEAAVDLGGKRIMIGTRYANATQSTPGLMSAADKQKLDGIAAGAQVNSITGVKGNAETTYRTGNVNITYANLGLGNFSGATASAAGGTGLVPAPAAGKQGMYLKGDGTWGTPTNTNSYISSWAWANGTSAGPTATITRTDGGTVSVAAIPTATASQSGVVTTGAQTFAGTKTFSSTISGSVTGSSGSCTGNAATATKFNSARSVTLTGNVTGTASADGSSGWSIATTIANGSVTSAKLGTDVYTVQVSSAQPTDDNVRIWIKV